MAQNLKWFCLFVLSRCIFKVFSVVSSPGEIKTVEHKEVRFLWNASFSIDEAKWGLVDGSIVTPFFIRVNKFIGEQKSADLDKNTSKAFPYKNRVHFIGNISRGWAWFVLTNLSTGDSKEYAADIKESGGIFTVHRVRLTVSPIPTTTTTTIITNVTSTTTPFSNVTDTTTAAATTAKPTPTPSPLGTGEIVGIVIGVLVVIAIIVGIVVCYVKKSKNNGSNGSNNKSGPLEMDKPAGDGNRTSPEA